MFLEAKPRQNYAPADALLVLRGMYSKSIGAGLPLQCGIDAEILKRTTLLTVAEVGAALALHVNQPAYWRALLQSCAMRVDLDSNPVEPVSIADRHVAAVRLDDHNLHIRIALEAENANPRRRRS